MNAERKIRLVGATAVLWPYLVFNNKLSRIEVSEESFDLAKVVIIVSFCLGSYLLLRSFAGVRSRGWPLLLSLPLGWLLVIGLAIINLPL